MTIDPVRFRYRLGVPDRDIVWAIQLYRSGIQIDWCLEHLRATHPNSRVVLIVDGDGHDYGATARANDCVLIEGTHLHRLDTCHLYVRRLLHAMAEGGESYAFRIDPDTCVWRQFAALPAFSCMFGTLETITEGRQAEIDGAPNVQGGCLGVTRDVVLELLASNVLTHDNCATRHLATWARCEDMARTAARGMFCDDFVLSWAARAIGAPIEAHDEIRSRWRRPVDNAGLKYAVTHPHKLVMPFGGAGTVDLG